MSTALKGSVAVELEAAWRRSDSLLTYVAEDALHLRPIALRQPFIFYLGHLSSFAWNHVGRRVLRRPAFRADYDALFERGIDPPDTDEAVASEAGVWPEPAAVIDYRERVRHELRPVLGAPELEATLLMVLEHELMHHETLLYMLLRLPHERKRVAQHGAPRVFDGAAPAGRLAVPGGTVRLGAARKAQRFAWDNEFPELCVEVRDFWIDATPVRQSQFLEFVQAGGYDDRRLWSDEAWEWKARRGQRHPAFWTEGADGWTCRTLSADVALEAAGDWPVYVSWCEAAAYARAQGGRLPSEAEYHRAAYGTPDGSPRLHPWGDAPPGPGRANVGLRHWAPLPVGRCAAGASAWGVLDLVGNGWEWTSTPFAAFPGFKPQPGYPGYSADFFDGRHYVLLGGSWATADRLVRPSFRNWYQPHYPYVFAQFRCVSESEGA